MDNGAHRVALLFIREIEAAEAKDGETDDGVRTYKRGKALISMAKAGQAIRQPPVPPPRSSPSGKAGRVNASLSDGKRRIWVTKSATIQTGQTTLAHP